MLTPARLAHQSTRLHEEYKRERDLALLYSPMHVRHEDTWVMLDEKLDIRNHEMI